MDPAEGETRTPLLDRQGAPPADPQPGTLPARSDEGTTAPPGDTGTAADTSDLRGDLHLHTDLHSDLHSNLSLRTSPQRDSPLHRLSPPPDVICSDTAVQLPDGRTPDCSGHLPRARSESQNTVEQTLQATARRLMTNGGPSLTSSSSVLRHRIIMEEVAPSHSSIVDISDREDWKVSLNLFTSKRHGVQDDDHKLPKRVRKYYREQDELINAFEDFHLDVHDAMEAQEKQLRSKKYAEILAKVSFFCNLALLIAKAVAAGLSGSLAIISSVVDSAVDLVSGALMWWSGRAMKKRNPYNYPQGRTKLEPLAIVILSVVMALASVQLIRESVERIIHYATAGTAGPVMSPTTITICAATIVVKLVLFLVCRKMQMPMIQALAQDHRNDVLSNSVALAGGLVGAHVWSFTDPISAIVICLYIIVSWGLTGREQIKMLTGHTARPDFLKKITWIALNHHPKIKQIDTVRVYHFGQNFIVEVDIVLPEDMVLRELHDIGETLQVKIERLPEVERAFVHLDYESEHDPKSEHKQV